MAKLLTNKSSNPAKATDQVRRKVQIDQPLNDQRPTQRRWMLMMDANDGFPKACDIVHNNQTSTKNPRLSYADMASNPNVMWRDVHPKSKPKAIFGKII